MGRILQSTVDCSELITGFNTTYNNNDKHVPFKGIMFEVFSKGEALEILGMELDILSNATDLSIEVYTKLGPYEKVMGSPGAWDLVARTTGVPAPEGAGVIVPAQDFQSFRMEAREIRSFYITMNEPVLDNRVNALQKTGEVPDEMRGDDIDIFVGIGFDDRNKFSGVPTTLSVDPQFAGVLYYRKPNAQCVEETSITTVNYQFLFNQELDGQNMLKIDAAIQEAFETLMNKDQVLSSLRESDSLSQSGSVKSVLLEYKGPCPDTFENNYCPERFLSSSLRFVHSSSLTVEKASHYLYSYVQALTSFLEANVLIDGLEFLYIGQESAQTNFNIILKGSSTSGSMDIYQQEYFEETTTRYLQASITSDLVSVFDTEVGTQEPVNRLRDRRILQEEWRVKGQILGTRPKGLSDQAFADFVRSALFTESDQYISSLVSSSVRPSLLSESDNPSYFTAITGISGSVSVVSVSNGSLPTGSEGGFSFTLPIMMAVIGVGALVLLASAIFLYRKRKQAKLYEKEVKEYRSRMKEERQARRLEKSKSFDSVGSSSITHGRSKLTRNESSDTITAIPSTDDDKSPSPKTVKTSVNTENRSSVGRSSSFDNTMSTVEYAEPIARGRCAPARSYSADQMPTDDHKSPPQRNCQPARAHSVDNLLQPPNPGSVHTCPPPRRGRRPEQSGGVLSNNDNSKRGFARSGSFDEDNKSVASYGSRGSTGGPRHRERSRSIDESNQGGLRGIMQKLPALPRKGELSSFIGRKPSDTSRPTACSSQSVGPSIPHASAGRPMAPKHTQSGYSKQNSGSLSTFMQSQQPQPRRPLGSSKSLGGEPRQPRPISKEGNNDPSIARSSQQRDTQQTTSRTMDSRYASQKVPDDSSGGVISSDLQQMQHSELPRRGKRPSREAGVPDGTTIRSEPLSRSISSHDGSSSTRKGPRAAPRRLDSL